MKFHVPDMSCGHCTAAIEKSVKAADPAAKVAPDLSSRTVEIDTSLDGAAVQKALQSAGYASTPV